MGFIIGLLTFIMVLDCLLLIFLVLMQLPKKEAGMGTAFGGGATDVLFGSGAGNVLTKTTKYAAGIFLVLSLILSVLGTNRAKSKTLNIKQKLEQKASSAPILPPPATPNAQLNPTPAAVPATNFLTIAPSNAAPATVVPAIKPAPAPAPAPTSPTTTPTNKPAAAVPAGFPPRPFAPTPAAPAAAAATAPARFAPAPTAPAAPAAPVAPKK